MSTRKPKRPAEIALLYHEAALAGEVLTDSLAALAARLTLEGMHPESREAQTMAIALHAQLGVFRFRSQLESIREATE